MVPSIYYGFYHEPALQKMYWAMVRLFALGLLPSLTKFGKQISSIGLACSWVSINPKFRSPLWRPFRAAMFALYGLSAVFPVFHSLALYGLERMEYSIGLYWVILQGVLYLLGAAIYAVSHRPILTPKDVFMLTVVGPSSREIPTWKVRCLGKLAPDLPYPNSTRGDVPACGIDNRLPLLSNKY